MYNVAIRTAVRPVTRLEEQEPDAIEALWERAVRDVEDAGEALGVEALMRANGDTTAATAWLMDTWRVWPDQRERAIRAEALQVVASFQRIRVIATEVAA